MTRAIGPGRSGKGAGDENFPVASLLISAPLRPAVIAFYNFARAGDDIADSADLSSEEKTARLDAMERALRGEAEHCGDETAHALRLRDALAEAGLSPAHAAKLLDAFRRDAVQSRCETWEDLMDYCASSADPVGRFLLDLHGEDRALWPVSDALCSALQILNHIQDCASDRRDLDRVYVPLAWLKDEGIDVAALDAPTASPELRRVLDRMLDGCDRLLGAAETLPQRLQSRRLAAESALIGRLATDLSARLRCGDPLSQRVAPRRIDKLRAGLFSIRALLVPTRPKSGSQRNA